MSHHSTEAPGARFPSPDESYPELFNAVQLSKLYPDSKTFADAVPRIPAGQVDALYQKQKCIKNFALDKFVAQHFSLPSTDYRLMKSREGQSVRDHIESLWQFLIRYPKGDSPYSSLIDLPRPFVIPGGRFQEIYYWDSYFTCLGLACSGRVDTIEAMVENFAYLIDELGFVPNGNRSYYCSRSQPPFFTLMVELLADLQQKPDALLYFLPQILKEYEFWMTDADKLSQEGSAKARVVKVSNGFLNRYWDDRDTPRPESYREDRELATHSERDSRELYRNLRAGCESGWDFSSRWLSDGKTLDSINSTRVLPVDLNALLYQIETIISRIQEHRGDASMTELFSHRAAQRRALIQTRCFCPVRQCYTDLWLPDLSPHQTPSLATAFPLFFNIASPMQAAAVASRLEHDFLWPGGWVTTLNHSGQQWDAPNGWAPLQWIVYQGLQNYGFSEHALEGAKRWVNNNLRVYRQTGKLLEKYNVEHVGLLAGGGEYDVQDGFGWTNGVLLRFMNELGIV